MRNKPEQKFHHFIEQQLAGLSLLHNQQLPLPFLMLLYATLDIVAFIGMGGKDSQSGPRFRDFADKYVIKRLQGITADDLWGARCGLLHTGTPESTKSRVGQVREMLYCWGKANIGLLHKVIAKGPSPDRYVAVSFEDLSQALADGVDEFLGDLQNDQALFKSCMERAQKFYAHIPVPVRDIDAPKTV